MNLPVQNPLLARDAALESAQSSADLLVFEQWVADFFARSEGQWRSQRRYYTLKDGEAQEVVSHLTVRLLRAGAPELVALARQHGLAEDALVCGAVSTWESTDRVNPARTASNGSTMFGVLGDQLYRDRGFATTKPVVARYEMPDEKTMRLYTEYGGSAFEEEIKLIGSGCRTRQTIISRSGEEIMVGQYLEQRL